jgi:hypothetical protein
MYPKSCQKMGVQITFIILKRLDIVDTLVFDEVWDEN